MLLLQSDEYVHELHQTACPLLPEYGRYSYRYRNAYVALSLHEVLGLLIHREWQL
ncbi:Uncharacterised protein [Vibrio cholerae]|uniref:Uncharacterized protein n=1 Tax=Vibrio cholerae TaxID=666 RepID=A0A655ZBD0_VIBCL|nr:Uncharacterised protein [Vibrio cholerae]